MPYNGFGLQLGRNGLYDTATIDNLATHTYKSSKDSMVEITTAGYFPPFLGADPDTVLFGDYMEVIDKDFVAKNYQIGGVDPIVLVSSDPGEGNVKGPGSSTDNAAVRWDGTTGIDIQNSSVIIGDSGTVLIPSILSVDQIDTIADTATLNIGPSNAGRINLGAAFVEVEVPGILNVADMAVHGIVILSSLSTGVVHSDSSGDISSSLVVNADVSASAAIADTKLATIATAGKVSNSATTATSANTANAIVARDSSGNIAVHQVSLAVDGVASLDAVTVQQLNAVAAGISIKQAARVATIANLTATYSNGASGVGATLTNSGTQVAIVIDGVTLSVNDRVLVKSQTSPSENGCYAVTNIGSGATNWILTRTTDFDSSSEITAGSLIAVNEGTVNANTSWLQTATVTTVGTDPILFSQFTASPASFLKVANNLSDLNNAATARTNLHLTDNTAALDLNALTIGSLTTGIAHLNGAGVISSSLIVNADVDAAAAIIDTKLATISTANKVSNSATTATSANTASAIVARDGSGNFSAGTITASITGASSLNLLKTNNLSDMATPLQDTQIGYGNSSNQMLGSNSFTWNNTTQTQTLGNSSAIVNTELHLQSTRDVNYWLEADTGNEGTEGSNPLIIFSQDANNTACTIGYDSDNIFRINKNGVGSSNDFIITVGATLSGGGTPGTMPTLSGGIDAINIAGSNGKLTLGGQLAIPATTNQMVLGTTNTTTITSTAPSSSKTYTIPDAGTNTSFVMGAGSQTIAGAKTFSTAPILSSLSTGILHSDSGGNLTSSLIVNADVDAAAAIVDTKLATIATANKVSNSATTATSANTASAIVARDGSGNFTAGTITATITGHSSLDLPLTGGTLTGALTINPVTNQLVLGTTNTTTITSVAPSASRTYTIPDAGANASFVMTAGAQTIAGTKTFSSNIAVDTINEVTTDAGVIVDGVILKDGKISLFGTSNQMVIGTFSPVTISLPTTASSYTYTIPDAGASTSFVMGAGAQTISGIKSFADSIKLATSGGTPTALDYYEVLDITMNFTGPFTATPTARLVRIGKQVTFMLAEILDTSTSAAQFTSSGDIPARFYPSASYAPGDGLVMALRGLDNSLDVGVILEVYTFSGVLHVDISNNDFSVFSASGTVGAYATSVTWITD